MTSQDHGRTTKTHGWGISLRYHGRTLQDLRVGDARPLRAGEAPDCALVVPGLGAAAVLADGAALRRVPGLGGVVRRGDRLVPYDECEGLELAPGDRVTLGVDAHPEITLELRREAFERLPLGTLIHLRELARQLTLGAGLLAGLVLLVRTETPVNVLEVKGDPDAPDSALVRAMFVAAAEAPRVELVPLPRLLPATPAPPTPEPVESEVAPMPLLLAAEESVPVPVAEVDAQPTRPRRRARNLAVKELATLAGDSEVFAVLSAVEGGVLGGVVGGDVGLDVLAEAREDAPALAMIGRAGGVGIGRVVGDEPDAGPIVDLAVDIEGGVDVVDEVIAPPPESGGGLGVVGQVIAPPPDSGLNSHSQAGVEVVRGVVGGVAAVAPARCDDPEQTPRSQLDVVFVVDVSTTMGFMLDRIEQQLTRVDAEARAQGLDARYGLVVFVDDVQLGNQGQPYADLAALQGDLARWRAFTASNRQIGSEAPNLDWPENTLDAVHAAATGFAWRSADTTLRLVVHATDDDFGEAPAVQSGQAVQHTYAQTVAALRDAQVRMFSFAARVGGQCECLDVRPGLFTRFHGRASLPDATGGAVFDIDEVASGKLSFVAAVTGAIKSGVCGGYPPSPFGAKQ